ncbi:PAS domain S-box protein [Fibrella arboris]|uniref:PAS domain S-box protein n=1 Tax=Fibrella arboris TaxID=3242486 RepID=UPI00352305B3
MPDQNKQIPDSKVPGGQIDIQLALSAARVGVWELNLGASEMRLDEQCQSLFGLTTGTSLPYELVLRSIYPADVPVVEAAISQAASQQAGTDFNCSFRVGGIDSETRWIQLVGQAYRHEPGMTAHLTGIAQAIASPAETTKQAVGDEQLRMMVEQAPVAIALLSGPQFMVTLVNERMLAYWGYKREQVIDKPLFDVLPDAGGPPFHERLTRLLSTGGRFVANEVAVPTTRNGHPERTYFDLVYEAVRDADGTISGITTTCFDVTDQVTARQKAQVSEARFRVLIEEAPIATCLFVGREFIVELANKPMLAFWGKGDNALGKPLAEAVPELMNQPYLDILDDIFTTGVAYQATAAPCDLEVDGLLATYYFNFTYKPIRSETGEVYAIISMAVDVTEQVLARNKLQESETYFRQLSDNVPAMIWTTRADGYCDYLNKQWYDFTGQDRDAAEGYGWLEGTHPDDEAMANQLFQEANDAHKPFNAFYRLRRKDGAYRWVVDLARPRFDTNGNYEGMIGTVVDVHEQKLAEEEQRKLITLIEASREFIGLIAPDTTIQYLNPATLELVGWPAIEQKTIIDCVYPPDRELAGQLWRDVLENGRISQEIRFVNERTGDPFWLQWNGVSIKTTAGELIAVGTVSPDISESRQVAQALEASEEKIRSLIANAPAGIGLFVGRDLIVDMPNQVFIDIVGKGPDIVGKPLREVMPELESQVFLQILDDVYTSGKMYQSFGTQVDILQRGVMTHNFYNITYSPLLDAHGDVYAILDIAIDVTQQIRAQKRLEESELFARSIIEHSPVAKAVFVGEYMVIKTVNERMLDMIGRTADIIGQPFMDVMPERLQTPLMERLQDVLRTGEIYYQSEERLDVYRFGSLHTGYYNYIYKPLTHITGERYGVLVTATEVTEQVIARQKIEESEAQFRLLLEAIPAIAWTNSPAGEVTFYNQRLYDYSGLSIERVHNVGWQAIIHPDDLVHSLALYQQALATGQDYVIENRYRRADGAYRWHLNRALPLYDETGQISNWVGTATDIHEQKQQEAELERQVAARTQQLHASVQDLKRSNDNLRQFAYIASHDLQEPLRKIQAFSTLLSNDYAVQLGAGTDYLARMQSAANRMSALIKDLLTYSRISTQQDATASVPLNRIVAHALTDLELVIEETGATVTVDPLPTILGDEMQLSQLFQNLLSNALKFRRVDQAGRPIAPVVQITTQRVAAADLPSALKPTREAAAYDRIDVTDNGIGFEEKYAERIFQVFQRLHSKNEFAGTGIGLAICEKVAANHGGAIMAKGYPHEGSTFSVYFPVTD